MEFRACTGYAPAVNVTDLPPARTAQIAMVVDIPVPNAASVKQHRVVEQRTIASWVSFMRLTR